MADPVSATGLVLQVAVVLKQLYECGKNVKSARKEIEALQTELYALKGVLEDVQEGQNIAGLRPERHELSVMSKTAHEVLLSLNTKLAPSESKLERAAQSLKWPFDKSQYSERLVKLERIKTWFLSYMMGDQRTAITDVQESLHNLTTIVQDDIAERRTRSVTEAQQKLLETLAPVSPDAIHDRACATWQDTNAGTWFVTGAYKDWLKSPSPTPAIMVLMGSSGSGKTTLVSRAIEETSLQSSHSILVAKAYCSYAEAASQELRNVLGSWLAQIARTLPSVLDDLDTNKDRLSVQQIENHIIGSARLIGTLLLVVDAVNESGEVVAIRGSIARMTMAAVNIKCLVSATPHVIGLSKEGCSYQRVDVQADAMLPDMTAYVERIRTRHDVLQTVPLNRLLESLLPCTDGMFRWLECQMQYLASLPTARLVLRALDDLPGTLDDTYESILLRVPRAVRHLVTESLTWLAFAHRPLTLNELNEAVIVEEGDRDIDIDFRLQPIDVLLTLCQGLLRWDPASSIVMLAHYSVWDYLTSDRINDSLASFAYLDESPCMKMILRKCLTYLLMSPFEIGVCGSEEVTRLQIAYPLLDYVATRWPLHAYKSSLGTEEMGLITALLMNDDVLHYESSFRFWIYYLFPDREGGIAMAASPLYYAASFGLHTVVETMVQRGMVTTHQSNDPWYIDHKCGRATSSPLLVAIYREHFEVARLLLKAGASPFARDVDGQDGIFHAEHTGSLEFAKLVTTYARQYSLGKDTAVSVCHATYDLALPSPFENAASLEPNELVEWYHSDLKDEWLSYSCPKQFSAPKLIRQPFARGRYYPGWNDVRLPYPGLSNILVTRPDCEETAHGHFSYLTLTHKAVVTQKAVHTQHFLLAAFGVT
ncbi:hypothetical protein LTR56_002968 [Elasticomyces elasticus]|nr:hypothetical protein LTR22_014691 [Elasticomyces elasticus]KAK3656620.1 hypothetical protein LTR56_002968 [Elasticomyces elasticus]KAK4930752.1 hypothetical protein LTR49_002840 [Elasticomyces elasticus]